MVGKMTIDINSKHKVFVFNKEQEIMVSIKETQSNSKKKKE